MPTFNQHYVSTYLNKLYSFVCLRLNGNNFSKKADRLQRMWTVRYKMHFLVQIHGGESKDLNR